MAFMKIVIKIIVLLVKRNHSKIQKSNTDVFGGSKCAICEGSLEHMLRGRLTFRFSCAHLTHSAFFYEHIKSETKCPAYHAPIASLASGS